jgi:ATP-dependent DNA helicase RecQ
MSIYELLLKDNCIDLLEGGEQYLYRLMILWIVKDYTVTRIPKKSAEVEFKEISCNEIKNNLIKYIWKYDEIESFKKYELQWIWDECIEKYVTILLKRSYDHHAYNRRQSLKNLYENCAAVLDNKLTNEWFKQNLEAYFKIDKKTSLIQDMVDDPNSIDQRTKVFIKKWQLISVNSLEELKQIVWRFLESYQNNIALNLISWFIRLFLWDFDNSDWRIRLENALNMILQRDIEYQNDRLNDILLVWKYLNEDSKVLLSELLIKYYKKTLKIYNELKDNYSKAYLLNMINTKLLYDLKNINDKH